MPAAPVSRGLGDAGKLVFINPLGVVKQPADEGALAIVNAAGSGKAKQVQK
jgi:hypothetical protein